MIGRVKWWHNEKKYGFIVTETEEFFAHFTEIQTDGYKSLKKGQYVEFDPEWTDKGPKAVMIFKIEKNNHDELLARQAGGEMVKL